MVVCTSIICVPLGLFSLVVGVVGIPGHISGHKPELVGAAMVLFLTPLTIAVHMVCCEEMTRPASVPTVVTHRVETTSSTDGDVEIVSVVHPLYDNIHHPTAYPFPPPPVY